MSHTLYIGDRTFSSWSYRSWLMLEKFNLTYDVVMTGLYFGTLAEDLADIAPTRTVPAITTSSRPRVDRQPVNGRNARRTAS
ncbi:hypothetical protein [Cognatiyoonia sp.]|uniref:hypothetical protein n=1 Tax=Cognatiyoonia sp. TaxID=2211652 RepID=UPI003F6951AC